MGEETMNLMNEIFYYVNMIGLVTALTLVVIIGVLFYFVKIKKVTASVERIDTSHFRREDSINYVPFEDVVTKDGTPDGEGMIVFSNNCFVGGISVRGFGYAEASSDERIDAQVYSVQFFNVVEKPTSFRQSVKRVDLSENIEYHREIEKRLAIEHLELDAQYRETLVAAEDYLDQPEEYERYEKCMVELRRLLYAKGHQLEEVKAEIGYMSAMSGDASSADSTLGQKSSQIMFAYRYNPDEHSQELSKSEIYVEAMEKLSAMASSYGEALAAAHFRTKRLTGKELIGLMRKHSAPITGEDFHLGELMDSSYAHLFISSDSLVEECKKKIGEDLYNKKLEEYQKQVKELLRMQEMERKRKGDRLKEEAMNEAYKQLKGEGGNISYGNNASACTV